MKLRTFIMTYAIVIIAFGCNQKTTNKEMSSNESYNTVIIVTDTIGDLNEIE